MIDQDDILEVKVTEKYLKAAQERANLFKGNKYTFSNTDASRIAGFVAEEVFSNQFPGVHVADDNYNADFIIENLGTIDIKTKRCKSKPKLSYDCSLSKYQAEQQNNEFLLFCRCSYDFEYLWILGIISKRSFMEKSSLIKKGDRDGSFVCRADMYNLKIQQLNKFTDFIYE